jgi:hypothetical protein
MKKFFKKFTRSHPQVYMEPEEENITNEDILRNIANDINIDNGRVRGVIGYIDKYMYSVYLDGDEIIQPLLRDAVNKYKETLRLFQHSEIQTQQEALNNRYFSVRNIFSRLLNEDFFTDLPPARIPIYERGNIFNDTGDIIKLYNVDNDTSLHQGTIYPTEATHKKITLIPEQRDYHGYMIFPSGPQPAEATNLNPDNNSEEEKRNGKGIHGGMLRECFGDNGQLVDNCIGDTIETIRANTIDVIRNHIPTSTNTYLLQNLENIQRRLTQIQNLPLYQNSRQRREEDERRGRRRTLQPGPELDLIREVGSLTSTLQAIERELDRRGVNYVENLPMMGRGIYTNKKINHNLKILRYY